MRALILAATLAGVVSAHASDDLYAPFGGCDGKCEAIQPRTFTKDELAAAEHAAQLSQCNKLPTSIGVLLCRWDVK